MSTIVTRAGKGSALTHTEVDANFTNLNTDKVEKTGTDPVVISVNSSSDALRITQIGAGNALLVEDSTNPDSSPTVITAGGDVIIGGTAAIPSYQYSSPQLNVMGGSAGAQKGGQYTIVFSNDAAGASVELGKSRSTTIGTVGTIVQSGDELGIISFNGDDGTDLRTPAATIRAFVDGTPSTNDMPGRLVFSTTADGASTPTERMRINNAGNVGIGTVGDVSVGLRVGKTITGSTSSTQIQSLGALQSDVTANGSYFATSASTQATAFTLTNLNHYLASQGTIGAGSTVTNQYGFHATSSLTGATNNYGFYSNIASGTGRWNFYANGTADNYFAGNLLVGVTSSNANGGILQLSKGITFPATQVAATDANTLDDYEEGTFTPTIVGTTVAGTGTYAANGQVGRYTKIGNRVYFNIWLNWTAHTGTGNMRVSGLPFTSNATAGNLHSYSVSPSNITLTAANYLVGYTSTSSTQVQLEQVPTGGGTSAVVPIDTAASLIVSGHYEV